MARRLCNRVAGGPKSVCLRCGVGGNTRLARDSPRARFSVDAGDFQDADAGFDERRSASAGLRSRSATLVPSAMFKTVVMPEPSWTSRGEPDLTSRQAPGQSSPIIDCGFRQFSNARLTAKKTGRRRQRTRTLRRNGAARAEGVSKLRETQRRAARRTRLAQETREDCRTWPIAATDATLQQSEFDPGGDAAGKSLSPPTPQRGSIPRRRANRKSIRVSKNRGSRTLGRWRSGRGVRVSAQGVKNPKSRGGQEWTRQDRPSSSPECPDVERISVGEAAGW